MAALVTLDEVKLALRIEGGDQDVILTSLIAAGSAAVNTYIKADADTVIDEADKLAVICQIDFWLRGDFENVDTAQSLCDAATALLRGKRTPTIA